jgi:hypothetical protein
VIVEGNSVESLLSFLVWIVDSTFGGRSVTDLVDVYFPYTSFLLIRFKMKLSCLSVSTF